MRAALNIAVIIGRMARRVLVGLIVLVVQAQDWPQFLGPTRNGVYPGVVPAGKPASVWKRDVGAGFSGPVVAQGKLILFHRVNDRETVESLDAKTGKTTWKFDYATAYRDDFGFDEGPRATPAIAAGRVYTFGAEGALHCLDFATGKKLWRVDTHSQFGVQKGFFGAAGSPLVEDNRVLLNAGGSNGAGIVALDASTGKTLWTATNDAASYSSPVTAEINGARHALFFTRAGLVDLDPATGKVRFQFPWRARMQASVNAAVPLVIGSLVFLSSSYGTGATLLDLSGGAPKQVWSSDDALTNHYATSVHHNGFLYGYHGRQEEGPSLRCVELKTGKVRWSVDQFRAGTITLAGDKLIVLRESGELMIAPASPSGFQPSIKMPALSATVRAYPAVAEGVVYVRNEKSLAAVSLR